MEMKLLYAEYVDGKADEEGGEGYQIENVKAESPWTGDPVEAEGEEDEGDDDDSSRA